MTDDSLPVGRPLAFVAALALVVAGQAAAALGLFGGVAGLADDRPVLSGRHPLHLYHATLGAETFRARGTTSCYDPNFQAGYPKTPVFDGGCRPAEFTLVVANVAGWPGSPAAAYKLWLFALCLAAPLALAVAGWGAGLSGEACVAAAAIGCALWWATPAQALLHAGGADALLAGLAALAFVTTLNRYAAEPSPGGWCALAGLALVGWYAQPLVWLGLLPVTLGHAFVVAPRHGLAWNLGRAAVPLAAVVPNLGWLTQGARFWWLRAPATDDVSLWPTADTLLGSWADYPALLGPGPLAWLLGAAGGVGLLRMARSEHKAAAGLLAGAVVVALTLGRVELATPGAKAGGVSFGGTLAAGWLALPAAYLLTLGLKLVAGDGSAARSLRLVGLAAVPLIAAVVGAFEPMPLIVGLDKERTAIVETLRSQTTPDARILWEESPPDAPGGNWSALLPTLTGRAFLGGLDGQAAVESSHCGLCGDRLNGRPLGDWTGPERARVVRQYNVGWVVARSPAVVAWWRADPTAREVARLPDPAGGTLTLIALDRTPSYFLTGSGTVAQADARRVVLTDVTPDANGEVTLSFHHLPGLRFAPSSVTQTTGTKDAYDPTPMLRLKTDATLSRVVIAWDEP
jgi:hypothetical protein